VLCGQLLMSNRDTNKKIQILLTAGVVGLAIGYGMDFLGITPIIKKIATSSFVFASAGWTILTFTFFYWLIDVKKQFTERSMFFTIVGMNSIFIYLFFEVGGSRLLAKIFAPFTGGLFGWGGEYLVAIMTSIAVWAACWYICYWFYKNRLFIKI